MNRAAESRWVDVSMQGLKGSLKRNPDTHLEPAVRQESFKGLHAPNRGAPADLNRTLAPYEVR
jgi:hypothetical protein